MPHLHLAFKNFQPAVIEATEALFAAKPWREDILHQVLLGQTWADACVAAYELPPVVLVWNSPEEALAEGTFYEPLYGEAPDEIRMSKFSIANLFIAFAKHRGAYSRARAGTNAAGWGLSLFYKVRPMMFRARVREGRIAGVEPRDLYTPETWARIVAAGLDPTQKNILSTLARIDAGEDQSFAAEEEMSAADEAAALESMVDLSEDNSEEEFSEAVAEADACVQEPGHDGSCSDTANMTVRELRRHATSLGVQGAWSMNREQINAALVEVSA